jgi:hypothetical protein
MDYSMDYSGDRPEQKGVVEAAPQYDSQRVVTYQPPRRQRGVPNIVTTIVAVGATFLVLCTAEGLGPVWVRPSTWVALFNGRIVREEKANEISQQAKLEAYVATVKLGVEQQNKHYEALTQTLLKSYDMQGQRAQAMSNALGTMQVQLQANRMAQTQATQGTDLSIINMSKLIGRVQNLLDEGSGDTALGYADRLSAEISKELEATAASGVAIKIEGWDTGLPSAEEMQRQLASLKPYTVPPPPRFDEETEAYKATQAGR